MFVIHTENTGAFSVMKRERIAVANLAPTRARSACGATAIWASFSDEGLVRGGTFSSLFAAVGKKGLAHLLGVSYEVKKALMGEILFFTNSCGIQIEQ